MILGARISNLDEIERGHGFFLSRQSRAVQESLQVAGAHAEREVLEHPTFRPRTGALQRSVGHRIIRLANGRLVRIESDPKKAPHGPAIEFGSKRHVIRARAARVLRFFWRGRLTFARSVNHPGNRPYKFLWTATWSANRVLGNELRRRLTDISTRF